jgi:hypothetical protein
MFLTNLAHVRSSYVATRRGVDWSGHRARTMQNCSFLSAWLMVPASPIRTMRQWPIPTT